jgi:hypothetical protein
MAIYEKLGQKKDIIRLREARVLLLYYDGEYVAARELQRENLEAFEQAGETGRVANALTLLAGIDLRAGEIAEGRAKLAQAARIFHDAGDRQAMVRVTVIASALAVAEGDFERAARLSGAGAALKAPLGEIATPVRMLQIADPIPVARSNLGDGAFETAFEAGRAMTIEDVVAFVQA